MSGRVTADSDIEVGAVEGDLRYWLAKEAVRQGEGRLNAQAAIRTALEARATALTGWAAVSLLAATGASFTVQTAAGRVGAVTAVAVLFAAAAVGIHAVRPRAWSMVGYDPLVVASINLASELEVLESMGSGLSDGVQANNIRLDAMGRMLRIAGWLLTTAPVAGGVAYQLEPVLSAWLAALLRLTQSGPA